MQQKLINKLFLNQQQVCLQKGSDDSDEGLSTRNSSREKEVSQRGKSEEDNS